MLGQMPVIGVVSSDVRPGREWGAEVSISSKRGEREKQRER